MLLSKQRMIGVMKRERLCLQMVATELCLTTGETARIIEGRQELDYPTARRLMKLLGYWNFAFVAEAEEVRVHARNIARGIA